jgi:hypothetical protein
VTGFRWILHDNNFNKNFVYALIFLRRWVL